MDARGGGADMPLSETIELMRTSGLEAADLVRLTWLKYQIRTGKRTEVPMEHKRLMFVRYLVEEGRIVG